MAPRPKPLQPDKEERRARLVGYFTTAVEELMAGGETYADLSVERLINAVDVSRSTFYAYFGDKSELLRAMGEDVTLDLAQAGAHWFELPTSGSKKDLGEALRPLFETYRQHQMVLRAITEAASYDAGIRELHQALVERAASGLESHIAAAQKAKTAAKELDSRRTALWLVWMLERGLHQLVASADEKEVDGLLGSMTDLVWRTLYEGSR